MLLVVLINSCCIIASIVIANQNILDIFDMIDSIISYIYIIEFVIKIVGLGIEKYFEDNWNIFDFIMILV